VEKIKKNKKSTEKRTPLTQADGKIKAKMTIKIYETYQLLLVYKYIDY
jgi:hypothetical protein